MRKHSVQVAASAVSATLVLLVAGCSSGSEAEQEHGAHGQEPTSQPADASAEAHNDTDVAFARDMIPHHEQAIVMSDIVLAKQDLDPRVVDLADQIKAAQGPEIETMSGWLEEWGASPAPTGHEGHDMHGDMSAHEAMGMLTEQELEALRQAQGVEASRLFLTGMIAHHEGAVTMAQDQIDGGQSEPAIGLAREIIDTQQREIITMRQILGSL